MYRQTLNRAAREQSQSGNTAEHNPPAAPERQQREGQPSMNPVRERFPSRRQQENSQHGRPPNTSTSQNRQLMGGPYRHEDSTPVPCDAEQLHGIHHLLPRCSLCSDVAACGHTFCWTCVSQHSSFPQPFGMICPICRMQGINANLYPEIESPFPLEREWAVPLIFADHAGNIKLNMAAVENYFLRDNMRDIPVYLLSVVGEKRTGKSFLMNYIIRALRNQVKGNIFSLGEENETLTGFEWKPGTLGTTKGVWIWSKPFFLERNGKKMALFVMDSEGLMDIGNDRNTSTKLFLSCVLLSTHLIFNVKGVLDEREVDYLEIYMHQAVQRAEQNKQYLDIVVRDWNDHEACDSKHAASYLKQQVEILRNRDISPAVLKALESDNTKCFLMPHPGKKISKSKTGVVKDMDEDFKESLTMYLKNLVERPKNPTLTGALLANMLMEIISHLQHARGDFASPQAMSDQLTNSEEMQNIIVEFQKFLPTLSSLQLPGTMWECISAKSSELVKKFEVSFSGTNADMRTNMVEELRSKLKEVGEKFYSDYKWKGIKYASSALLLVSGPLGGMMFAGEAAAAATTTGFLPTALSYAQYFGAVIAGRFLGRWL
ncbi:hypothetical protein XENTR_v10009740 [Xenopus tropicalis]|uniref:RING finger protein 112 n=1 Tax=Xenopus tropicalis TaxID=8364 RepID=A0A803JUA3_XENTR|nr:RING finger protein 112 [Xenopus tropicalis]KAE8619374.1 hypothetical protein XENTR_v10009740 [Xenopus tropicalis]|eukprot:XP_012814863.1 PREDICTED: RING finger protein 112-like isoform X1 [Xenopus tropicalis]